MTWFLGKMKSMKGGDRDRGRSLIDDAGLHRIEDTGP